MIIEDIKVKRLKIFFDEDSIKANVISTKYRINGLSKWIVHIQGDDYPLFLEHDFDPFEEYENNSTLDIDNIDVGEGSLDNFYGIELDSYIHIIEQLEKRKKDDDIVVLLELLLDPYIENDFVKLYKYHSTYDIRKRITFSLKGYKEYYKER